MSGPEGPTAIATSIAPLHRPAVILAISKVIIRIHVGIVLGHLWRRYCVVTVSHYLAVAKRSIG